MTFELCHITKFLTTRSQRSRASNMVGLRSPNLAKVRSRLCCLLSCKRAVIIVRTSAFDCIAARSNSRWASSSSPSLSSSLYAASTIMKFAYFCFMDAIDLCVVLCSRAYLNFSRPSSKEIWCQRWQLRRNFVSDVLVKRSGCSLASQVAGWQLWRLWATFFKETASQGFLWRRKTDLRISLRFARSFAW